MRSQWAVAGEGGQQIVVVEGYEFFLAEGARRSLKLGGHAVAARIDLHVRLLVRSDHPP